MPTFTMTTDNNITAFENEAQVQANIPPEGFEVIATTKKEFDKATAGWPISRFVEVWNDFAGVPPFGGVQPVKKFTDRKTAATRIWKTIQVLGEDLLRTRIRETEANLKATTQERNAKAATSAAPAQHAATVAKKKAKASKQTTAKDAVPTAREGSKKAIVIDLLKRDEGATLQQLMDATGWQKHSVRGFLSGSLGKKMGLTVESSKDADGARTYSIK